MTHGTGTEQGLPLSVHDPRAKGRCEGCGVTPGRSHRTGCQFEPAVARFCRRVWPFTEYDR